MGGWAHKDKPGVSQAADSLPISAAQLSVSPAPGRLGADGEGGRRAGARTIRGLKTTWASVPIVHNHMGNPKQGYGPLATAGEERRGFRQVGDPALGTRTKLGGLPH